MMSASHVHALGNKDRNLLFRVKSYIIRASFSQERPPWCDPSACRIFRLSIIPKLAFKYKGMVIGLGQGMTYIAANDSCDGVSKVIYQSKDGTTTKTFDALDWLAQLVTHIPNKGELMVRYYGFYGDGGR